MTGQLPHSETPPWHFQGCTALHQAASVCTDSLDVVELLLANGADINASDDNVGDSNSMLADGKKPVTT